MPEEPSVCHEYWYYVKRYQFLKNSAHLYGLCEGTSAGLALWEQKTRAPHPCRDVPLVKSGSLRRTVVSL